MAEDTKKQIAEIEKYYYEFCDSLDNESKNGNLTPARFMELLNSSSLSKFFDKEKDGIIEIFPKENSPAVNMIPTMFGDIKISDQRLLNIINDINEKSFNNAKKWQDEIASATAKKIITDKNIHLYSLKSKYKDICHFEGSLDENNNIRLYYAPEGFIPKIDYDVLGSESHSSTIRSVKLEQNTCTLTFDPEQIEKFNQRERNVEPMNKGRFDITEYEHDTEWGSKIYHGIRSCLFEKNNHSGGIWLENDGGEEKMESKWFLGPSWECSSDLIISLAEMFPTQTLEIMENPDKWKKFHTLHPGEEHTTSSFAKALVSIVQEEKEKNIKKDPFEAGKEEKGPRDKISDIFTPPTPSDPSKE